MLLGRIVVDAEAKVSILNRTVVHSCFAWDGPLLVAGASRQHLRI